MVWMIIMLFLHVITQHHANTCGGVCHMIICIDIISRWVIQTYPHIHSIYIASHHVKSHHILITSYISSHPHDHMTWHDMTSTYHSNIWCRLPLTTRPRVRGFSSNSTTWYDDDMSWYDIVRLICWYDMTCDDITCIITWRKKHLRQIIIIIIIDTRCSS